MKRISERAIQRPWESTTRGRPWLCQSRARERAVPRMAPNPAVMALDLPGEGEALFRHAPGRQPFSSHLQGAEAPDSQTMRHVIAFTVALWPASDA